MLWRGLFLDEMKNDFLKSIQEHTEAVQNSFFPGNLDVLTKMVSILCESLRSGGKILICGNGGSAADAQHMAAELIGRFRQERKSLPAIALTADTSILTAVSNDYGFENVFSRQVEGLGVEGDVLMGISTSGNSKNILKAVQKARDLGLVTVGLTGSKGGALKDSVDLCFCAEAAKPSLIQEIHILTLHAVCDVIEKAFLKV
jgi:D-sedoheptulose 7-phosphate isomerase